MYIVIERAGPGAAGIAVHMTTLAPHTFTASTMCGQIKRDQVW
jgi:hypothetical protein